MKLLTSSLGLASALIFALHPLRAADDTPRTIFDPAAAGADQFIKPNPGSENDVTITTGTDGIDVKVIPNSKSGFPGVLIKPDQPWDATGKGHLEVKITNLGTTPLRPSLRIDNEGPWQENRWSADLAGVKPGQSSVVKAIFGYQYGKAGYALKPSEIVSATIFIGRKDVEQHFKIEQIVSDGPPDEKPFIDPNSVAVKPPGGVVLGTAPVEAKQIVPKGGATGAVAGTGLKISFAGGKEESITFKPVAGFWNLNMFLQVKVKVKNTGSSAVTPLVSLESKGGPSDPTPASAPIAPGQEAEIAVPFAAAKPAVLVATDEQLTTELKKNWDSQYNPGTGTKYTSNSTTGVTISSDKSLGAKSLEVTSITADLPPAPELPAWLGQKPPVDGEWTKTFDENFDGNAINLNVWNIYSPGEWHIGAATHYTKDNVIVKDGKLSLRVEKKPGHHNDDPTMLVNDLATGYADTFGKWTQRYGYFEARMKLPTAPNMFLAFWMMPDRGLGHGDPGRRASTQFEGRGMEFDIMETLSIWGPYRHDFGMHWDGYGKNHKSNGMFTAYAHPDKDGFITVGMLWLPGLVVMYDNGKEAARWESSRISDMQSYFILDHATGGWEAEALDEKQLPADFTIDYIRAWQRKDLATPEDGAKPNDGQPKPQT